MIIDIRTNSFILICFQKMWTMPFLFACCLGLFVSSGSEIFFSIQTRNWNVLYLLTRARTRVAQALKSSLLRRHAPDAGHIPKALTD